MYFVRQDRLFNLLPGVTDEQFENSQFLELYNQMEKCPSSSSVIDSLLTLEIIYNRSHPVIRAIDREPPSYNAIKAYTSDFGVSSTRFYKYINEQLLRDEKDTLAKLMPFIRRATYQINNNTTDKDCILYRGMHLTVKQLEFFTIGRLFRFPGFTPTTEKEEVARRFGNTLFEVHVIAPCHQVVNMTHISYYKEEYEWLFSPYSRFQVIGIADGTIILQSIDNLVRIENNPSYNEEERYSIDTKKDYLSDSDQINGSDKPEHYSYNSEDLESSNDGENISRPIDEISWYDHEQLASIESRHLDNEEERYSIDIEKDYSTDSAPIHAPNKPENYSYNSEQLESRNDGESVSRKTDESSWHNHEHLASFENSHSDNEEERYSIDTEKDDATDSDQIHVPNKPVNFSYNSEELESRNDGESISKRTDESFRHDNVQSSISGGDEEYFPNTTRVDSSDVCIGTDSTDNEYSCSIEIDDTFSDDHERNHSNFLSRFLTFIHRVADCFRF